MIELTKPELYTVLGILATIITVLWGLVIHWFKTNSDRLRRHEIRQDDDNMEIKRLTGEMHYIKGQMDGISQLSRAVLNEISNLKLKHVQQKDE